MRSSRGERVYSEKLTPRAASLVQYGRSGVLFCACSQGPRFGGPCLFWFMENVTT
jgi:hypothetical protein